MSAADIRKHGTSLGKRPEQIELFPSPTSSQSITTTAPASSPMGLHVRQRIPPCGRGRSSSSWCEVEIVQGAWTCLACNCIAPGNITVASS
jgi:hypothetical protein